MKHIIISFLALSFMMSCTEKSIQYPPAKKGDVKDTYFGTEVEDPYRWLEDDNSAETAEWVKTQNQLTFGYLEKLPYREQIKTRLTELWDYPKYGTPFKEAGKYFFYKNNGLQNQSVLYTTTDLAAVSTVLLDPNTLSQDGTAALNSIEISNDGKYLIYQVAKSGSDWNEIFVKNIETGKILSDHILWVKFSGCSWYKDGFFYSAYDKPEVGSELSKSNEFQKVYFHKLGTEQSADQLIVNDPVNAKRMFGAGLTDDKRFLLISKSEGTSGNALDLKDLSKDRSGFVCLMESYEYDFNPVDNNGDELFVLTNYKAPKYRLIKINTNHPEEANWVDIIPEKKDVLQSVRMIAGKLVVNYMTDAHSKTEVYSYEGVPDHEVNLPGIGTVSAFSGKKEENIAYYNYTSFNTPGEIYKYDFTTKQSTLHFRPEVKFNPDDFEVKQEFYTSKDGTKVPMFIVNKKGIELNGSNPTLLYAYGGFNISLTPSFSAARMAFLENGGVFVMANLRGGGEYGEEWHKAGTKLQKQNVFDDFIAAAEYLISKKYTSSKKLAIQGGSNGGLLIGAATNQRPELFKVALPQVGVMDMLRYHKFTIGWAWATDFGTSADNEEMFKYLYNYSPYHSIKKDVAYPAVLATTADHDDRVVPAHTFKYMARLQEYGAGNKLPLLVRIDAKAGHGAGKPTAKVIEEYTDVWSFVFYHLGMKM
ncbi:MAG: prolyl oligopeptidase family serine peptidase [Bacteroidota bacterium]|nr:S9 family peptidase [Odoribacter sp.]MDP3643192.1 prolyl oligopeptidase family serine peptidase [Bacteroidota bacterium]